MAEKTEETQNLTQNTNLHIDRPTPEEVEAAVVSDDFKRGVEEGVREMKAYFMDENEGAIYEELPNSTLDDFESGAVQTTIADEKRAIASWASLGLERPKH